MERWLGEDPASDAAKLKRWGDLNGAFLELDEGILLIMLDFNGLY
jgi:hypothetical protein